MSSISRPKVLIVSDQRTTGPMWSFALQQNQILTALEQVPAKAVERWLQENADLVLFDIMHPLQAIPLIVNLRQETLAPVLLILRDASEELLILAYEAGVDECFFKPISPTLFLAKIKAWLRRTSSASPDTLVPVKAGGYRLAPTERLVFIGDDRPVHLTYLEFRLLYLLMSRPDYTLTSEELIQRVWGYKDAVDTTVLKNMVYRLRQKIEDDPSDPQRILTVVGVGYRFAVETP